MCEQMLFVILLSREPDSQIPRELFEQTLFSIAECHHLYTKKDLIDLAARTLEETRNETTESETDEKS